MNNCKYCGIQTNNKVYCGNSCQMKERTLAVQQNLLNNSDQIYKLTKTMILYLKNQKNNTCEICGWNELHPSDGKPLVEVDHIDGNSANNNLSNLRVICPNCHSMTDTYRARNKKSARIRPVTHKILKPCIMCETPTSNKVFCTSKCQASHQAKHIPELSLLVESYNKHKTIAGVSREFDISHTTIIRMFKKHNIPR